MQQVTDTFFIQIHWGKLEMQRRSFLNYFLWGSFTLWLGSVAYPVFSFLWPQQKEEATLTEIMAGKVDEFEIDSGKVIQFGTIPALIIRTTEDEFKVFDARCTHLDCTVQYRQDLGVIWCACHNGKYDLTGKNISGPPPRPLSPLKAVIKDNQVFITKA